MKTWILALSLGVILAGCSGGSDKATGGTDTTAAGGSKPTEGQTVALTGAGSTFVNPAMAKWAYAYTQKFPNVTVNYQSVGSGAGISQFKKGTVDFGATDVAMPDKDLADISSPAIQIPMIAGCTVVAYNLPGIQNGLKLSGDVLADIYLGKITKWNDARITAQNAGLKLPDLAIQVIHRSDGSGTTYIFTDYLCEVSPQWKAGPGKNKSPKWPIGLGGKGSEGVAGLIQKTSGGIGYVELAYALQTKLNYGPIKNKSGKYVDPSVDSTSAAINASMDALKKDIRTSVVDTSAPDGYPIAGMTYAIISKAPKDAARGKSLVDFMTWVLGPGQDMAKELNYAPLPKTVVDLDTSLLGEVQTK